MANRTSQTGREGLVGDATSQVKDAAATAQQQTVELKERGKGKLGETLDQRTNQAGVQARKMAQALRRSSGELRSEGEGEQVAGFAESAADRVDQLGEYLERTSGDQLMRDAEDFARRRPWMIAGIGLLAGLAASRFLKASSERRYGSMQTSNYPSPYGYGALPPASGGRSMDDRLTRESYQTSGE
jgi:ElaB/YqjD/DUF883 family membrane-anchored ribosome-binding protein